MRSSILTNKVVAITGGAGLLGQEFVKSVVLQGGTAVIADINKEISLEVVESLKSETLIQSIDYFHMDITSKESIKTFIDLVSGKYGKIDAIVNNAYPRNRNYGRKFEAVEYSDFCDNVNLHLGGYFLTSQQFAEFFKKQGSGNIINISSIYGVMAPRFEVYGQSSMTMPVEYAAIKSAVIHLSKYIAKYYKGSNIRCNVICPGGIFDNQNPDFVEKYNDFSMNKGMLDKKDITGTLQFLLSDLSEFVNGQVLVVDDGWSL